ncbi:unnamed protein product [Calypogeia fissa]
MASAARGGKPARMSTKNWASFFLLCLMGLLVALVSFSDIARRSDRGGVAVGNYYRRVQRSPSDINCVEEVGAVRKYIPTQHQYHAVQRFTSKDATSLLQKKCSSRYKQHCYWKSNYHPSLSFLRALRTYEAHHRKCTEGRPLTDLAMRGSAPSKCKYLVWRDLDGKGNQLISLVSAFVYALLTDRALLITRGAELQHLLCEPFPQSSWLLPEDFPDDRIRESAEVHGVFYDRALNSLNSSTTKGKNFEIPKRLEAFMSNWQTPSDLKFFCEGEQKLVTKVPWVFYRSNQYSVPGFYFIKSFRSQLNAWFPDRAVFLHAGRYLLSPQNEIWDQIMNVYKSEMASADRRLAIQVRAWGNGYTPIISAHIHSCAVYTGLLPNLTSSSENPSQQDPNDGVVRAQNPLVHHERISVVLTSLRKEYAEKLAEVFNKTMQTENTSSGSKVRIVSPSSEGEQQTGHLSHDRKVIADMWLLSFADDMVSSPRSTFGYVSHGLAGIKPIVFNQYGISKEEVPNPPCWRSNLPGPCFIDHPDNMECPLEPGPSYIGDAHTDLEEVRPCELQWGIGVFEEN